MARVRGDGGARRRCERARVSPKGDPKPAEPRYNKGGIAVVKSAESLNSWYRSATASPTKPPPGRDATPVPRHRFRWPRVRARNYQGAVRAWLLFLFLFLSFFSPPEDSAITSALACMSLSAGNLERASLSFSLFFARKRVYHAAIPLGRTKPAETFDAPNAARRLLLIERGMNLNGMRAMKLLLLPPPPPPLPRSSFSPFR